MSLSTGQTLNNRYRIVKLLGQGGFGAVYRVWDMNLERTRALKENLDTSEKAQRQFKREAQILTDLIHPNLPRVMDHFIIPGQGQYLVMDFVEGQDLGEMLQDGLLPEDQVLPWIIQVCDALSYLHSQNPPIIHRDIKPANIKITTAGKAMLVDFGISKVYDPQLSTTVGAKAVTPGYSPPEQYGQGSTDARSDLYALGATLYHLLTGHTPPDSVDIMAKNVPPPIPPVDLNPTISKITGEVITKAMALEREERWGSANEFQENLRRVKKSSGEFYQQSTHPVTADVPDAAQPEGRTLQLNGSSADKRRIWIFGSLGVVIVLLCFVATIFLIDYFGVQTAPPMPTETPVPTEIATQTVTPTSEETPEPETEEACEFIEVPDVIGMTIIDAEEFLTSQGYGYTWEDEYLRNTDVGLIINQDPDPGVCSDPDNTVLILFRNLGLGDCDWQKDIIGKWNLAGSEGFVYHYDENNNVTAFCELPLSCQPSIEGYSCNEAGLLVQSESRDEILYQVLISTDTMILTEINSGVDTAFTRKTDEKVRLIPDGFFIKHEGSAAQFESDGSLYEQANIERIEELVATPNETTGEIYVQITYSKPFWENESFTKNIDLFTGEVYSHGASLSVAPSGGTKTMTVMGVKLETREFTTESTFENNGWRFQCSGTGYYHPEVFIILDWQNHCDIYDTNGDFWGTEEVQYGVTDTNLFKLPSDN